MGFIFENGLLFVGTNVCRYFYVAVEITELIQGRVRLSQVAALTL